VAAVAQDPAFVEARGIRKVFPGTIALDGVDFSVRPGEIHALVGENGAGKSTLVSILAGLQPTYEGEILVAGEAVHITTPRQAVELGISLIQQELSLVPEMSVSENIFLGQQPRARLWGFIDFRQMDRRARQLLEELGVELPARTHVVKLSAAQRQLVEIAKGVAHDPKLLILDEPTSSLSRQETEQLFALIRSMREREKAIVYITHKLDEVFAIADRATVLRDGERMATKPISEWDEDSLVRAMVGRELRKMFPKSAAPHSDEMLRVENLGLSGRFEGVSFSLRRGEILGLAGLIGAGRSEVAEALFGLAPADTGAIFVEGLPAKIRTPVDAIRLGIGLVPEDRRLRGLIEILSISKNVSLPSLRRFCSAQWVRCARERSEVERITRSVGLRAPRLGAEARTLSGGNQQKAVIAKWLLRAPKILILDEPTRGIDVGAKAEIYGLIDRLAAEGVAILMISSELPEILGVSDRILVMRMGRVAAEFARDEASEELVVGAATMSTRNGVAA
jgi:inositol transport system ATP-binding protein